MISIYYIPCQNSFRSVPRRIWLTLVGFFVFCFPVSANSDTPNLKGNETVIGGAKLPPTTTVTRKNPKLVNYFHMNLSESNIAHKEEMLAQWDIIILNPDNVTGQNISLSNIRSVNPNIKILAWIPFGQEPEHTTPLGNGIPAESDTNNWYVKTTGGQYAIPSWGGHLMNPYAHNFAWPKYAINFISDNYLDNNQYDGILFDVLVEWAPTFASPDNPQTADINGDGVFDNEDNIRYQEGINYLLSTLRADYPEIIFTGNGGDPWTSYCTYFDYANGNMHENALGNEWGGDPAPLWYNHYEYPYGAWDGMLTCLDPPNSTANLLRIHFLSVDLRMDRTQTEAQNLASLTDDDLRRMRLGLCTTLMMDGAYFSFDRGDCLHGQLWWFDEYNADIGEATETNQANVYGSETYSRIFENGIVIINYDTAKLRITLPQTYRDVTTNLVGTQFEIPANDARIFSGTLTGTEESRSRPLEFLLDQNYPNPFSRNTVINYILPDAINVTLKVYDAKGKEVRTLLEEKQIAGSHSVTFDANELSEGVYYYRLQTGDFQETRKMILHK
jgi:hypothetical protein